MRHILLCGERGAGKSTLIAKLLAANTRPVYGFVTQRMEADGAGYHPIYLHPAGAGQRAYTDENRVGLCNARTHRVSLEVFNGPGARLIREAKPGGLIVMDELGFMEAGAKAFTRAVFGALDGDAPVLAAVKARYDVPFLNAVRAHPKARVYAVDADNRDALYDRLLPILLGWNRE